MKLIDIDQIKSEESHIHYIKNYNARAIFMDLRSKIFKYEINFSLEYNSLGPPIVKVKFKDNPHFPVTQLISKIKQKILEMNEKGVFTAIN